ncbi:hypothetical protein [Paracoccus sp. (in: a-proteobacteria)]|uniref:hypothetical protein n=1 Tax=Paracoccus sp. TaxID=267 RepID=UPI002AFE0514|nr:hypothetical protein [Paracoccus sp. (in: a-proteobacteria)]
MIPNCLSEGETLADLARRECAIGFDLRFCRSVAVSEHDLDTETCDPTEAEFATLYALTDLGEGGGGNRDPRRQPDQRRGRRGRRHRPRAVRRHRQCPPRPARRRPAL